MGDNRSQHGGYVHGLKSGEYFIIMCLKRSAWVDVRVLKQTMPNLQFMASRLSNYKRQCGSGRYS